MGLKYSSAFSPFPVTTLNVFEVSDNTEEGIDFYICPRGRRKQNLLTLLSH